MANNSKSGNAHFSAKSEDECIAQVRKLLSYLPQNNLEEAPEKETGDDPLREDAELRNIVPVNPNKGYDVREVIRRVVDESDFFEVQPLWAKNILTGYARLGGKVIGIIANQANHLAGCLDIDASDKASRFIRHCDAFNIPVVTFVDVPGYSLALLRNSRHHPPRREDAVRVQRSHRSADHRRIAESVRRRVPGMCSSAGRHHHVAAGRIAVMGAEGAANIVFRREIEASEDSVATRTKKIEEYREAFANPYVAAERGLVDRVILPEATRGELWRALVGSESKRELRPRRKHGVMPH